MEVFEGTALTPGIAISTAIVQFTAAVPVIPRYRITSDQHTTELQRLENAIAGSIRELRVLLYRQSVSQSEREILEMHVEMLNDTTLRDTVEQRLKVQSTNVESIVHDYIDELSKTLLQVDDEYLRERTVDFYDISRRILSQLLFRNLTAITLDKEAILVVQELTPSDFIHLNKSKLKGLILEAGGKNSHTTILARSFGIPSVVGLSNICARMKSGTRLILDGNEGKIISNPTDEVMATYQALQKEERDRKEQQIAREILPSITLDGVPISLLANIEFPEEMQNALCQKIEGIGLFRSEFLFIGKDVWPEEEEQYEAYRYVLSEMKKMPVVIRTLDIGGDKMSPGVKEPNPIMGWRAVRFSLTHRAMFRMQIRALLRASTAGTLKILIPMISGIEEIIEVVQYIDAIKEELREEGIPVADHIPLGAMIEVPSAALIAGEIAAHVDFLSIGTNDLVQYTLAVDRGNEYVSHLYNHLHPGVLRLIKSTIEGAQRQNIPVEICGEMAGGVQELPLLMGLGLRTFSMSSVHLPAIRQSIRRLSISQSEELVKEIMCESSVDTIVYRLQKFSQTLQRTTHS